MGPLDRQTETQLRNVDTDRMWTRDIEDRWTTCGQGHSVDTDRVWTRDMRTGGRCGRGHSVDMDRVWTRYIVDGWTVWMDTRCGQGHSSVDGWAVCCCPHAACEVLPKWRHVAVMWLRSAAEYVAARASVDV